ncbi:MAG: hypothetical protein HY770_04850 [Chitinivibrionia bacterium]|nr:hypothetical protein [Chitinivibrionia bacterium]
MDSKRRIACCISLLCLCFMLASCETAVVHRSRPVVRPVPVIVGPPPHAPAHGYRHKHAHGMELVYDAHLGIYVVAGYTDYYYYERNFYRLHEGQWQISARIDGPWKTSSKFKLPKGLKQQKAAKHKDKKK